jgi:hypothetical protein
MQSDGTQSVAQQPRLPNRSICCLQLHKAAFEVRACESAAEQQHDKIKSITSEVLVICQFMVGY